MLYLPTSFIHTLQSKHIQLHPVYLPVMVGCKDDPSHKLRNLPSLHQQSPTQDEQDTRLDRWFHTLSHTPTTTPIKAQDNPALNLQSVSRSHPIKHSRPPANAQSNKRKALTELEPLHPRKSARLEQKQPVPAYQMSTSPTKKKAGKAREASACTQNKDEEQAGVSHVVTRGRSQGKGTTETSSDKENRDRARGIAVAVPIVESAEMTRPLLRPVAVPVSELSSPSKRKDPSSRPSSPTKSNSTKTSKAPQVDKRERLALLNPPVQFFTRAYLGQLGGKIPPLVKKLWVDYIELDDQGYIPQALKVCRPSSHTGTDTDKLFQRQGSLPQPQTNPRQASTHLRLQAIPSTAKMIMRGFGRLSRTLSKPQINVDIWDIMNRTGFRMWLVLCSSWSPT